MRSFLVGWSLTTGMKRPRFLPVPSPKWGAMTLARVAVGASTNTAVERGNQLLALDRLHLPHVERFDHDLALSGQEADAQAVLPLAVEAFRLTGAAVGKDLDH